MNSNRNIFFATLIPFACAFYSISAQNSNKKIPRDTSYTIMGQYKKYVKDYPEIKPGKDSLPENVKAKRNVVYTTLKDTPYGDRDLHLDIFYPKKPGEYPALIMIHGGAWVTGDKSMQVPMAQKLAAKGYVTICVEYQLTLEAKYPAAVFNIKSAIRWMRANAEKYNINTKKIGISGSSAGGQLAMLVGLTNGVKSKEGNHGNLDHPSDVNAIIDLDGVINFMAPRSLNSERKQNSPDVKWLGGTFEENPKNWKDASSIYWANENSVPILFINSNYPRFHAGQDELIAMMTDWGIYTEVKKMNLNAHAFWLFEPWIDTTVNYMDAFLIKVFNN
ncbi:alpha/beta hydrolase fold domain-containing protein [Flavisericum labens]|uniref:alpha/beta hydrolase fold domain-containing protein n=1 Tax=Flavisericum labens TaxID=3377112 RepID=UPI00387B3D79